MNIFKDTMSEMTYEQIEKSVQQPCVKFIRRQSEKMHLSC